MKKHYKLLPKSIKIGQRDFKVVTQSAQVDVALKHSYGYTNIVDDYIVLSDDMSAGRLRSTVLHEAMHAIALVFHNSEAEVSAREKGEDYDDYWNRWEHHFISLYDNSMTMLLRDNPELVDLLIGR